MCYANEIPPKFFLYWSGQDFQYVNYLCVLSLLKTNNVETCDIYYEEEPNENANWERLKKLDRVHLIRLSFDELFERCHLEKKEFDNFFKYARRNHRSDLFRYLILFCEGGVFIDFDFIFIKDIGQLLNTNFFLGAQYRALIKYDSLNGAILGSERNSGILKYLIGEAINFSKNKTAFEWSSVGPFFLTKSFFRNQYIPKKPHIVHAAINRVFRALILLNLINNRMFAYFCRLIILKRKDVSVYPWVTFYYIPWPAWKEIFRKNTLLRKCYAIHFWQSHSNEFTRKIDEAYIRNENSLYANVARRFIEP